jgi:pentatricopeptide repeat protein
MHVMAGSGVPVEADGFAAMLAGCEPHGEGDKALELVATMKRRGVEPSAAVLRFAVIALLRDSTRGSRSGSVGGERWEAAVGLLDEFKQEWGLDPDPTSLREIADCCRRKGGEEALPYAEALLEMAEERQAVLDAASAVTAADLKEKKMLERAAAAVRKAAAAEEERAAAAAEAKASSKKKRKGRKTKPRSSPGTQTPPSVATRPNREVEEAAAAAAANTAAAASLAASAAVDAVAAAAAAAVDNKLPDVDTEPTQLEK